MSCLRVGHIALRVESLRQAEGFYMRLFGLRVLFREKDSERGPVRLPENVPWEDAEKAGWIVKRSFMGRSDFRLALYREAADFAPKGRLDHICLWIEAAALPSLHAAAVDIGCRIWRSDPISLSFDDLYGVRWIIMTGEEEECR